MTSSSGMHSSSLSSDQRVRRKEESQKEKEEEEEEEGEGEQETGQEGGRKEEVHGEKTKDGEDEERKNVKQVAVSLYLLKHPSPFFPLAEYSHPLSDQYEEDTLVTPSSSSFPSSSLKERREKKGLSPGKIDLEPKARAGFEEEEEKEDDDLDADILSILEKNGWGSKTPDSRRKMLLSSTSSSSSFFSSPSPSPSPAALILLPSPRSSSSAPPLSSSSRIETAGTFSSPPHPEFSPSPSSSSTFVSPSSSRDQRKKKAATSSSLSLPREEDPNGKRRRRRREEAEEKEQEKNGDSKRPRSKRVDSTSLRSFPGVASHMKAPASSSSSFSSSYQNVPFRDSSTNTGGALPALQERREGESSRNLAKRKKKKNGNMAAMGEKKQGEEEEGEGEQQPVKRKRVRYRRSRVGSRRRMSLPPPSREILDATHTKQKDKKRRHVLESLESEVIRKKEDEKDLLYKGKEEEEEKEQVPPSLHRDRQRGSLKQKTPPYRHLLSSLERPPDEGDKEEANYSSSSSSLALLDEVVKKMKEKEEETSLSSPLKEEKKSVENPEKRAKTGDEEDQVEKKKEEEMRELMHKKNEEGDDDEEEKKRQRLLHREERRGKEEGKEGRKLGGQEEEEVQVKEEEGEDKRTSSATHPPAVRLSASSLSSSRPASSFSFSFSVYEDDPNVNTPRAAFSSDLPPRHGGRKSPFPLLSHSLLRPSSSSLLPLSRGGLPRVSNDQKKFLLPAVEAALEERGGREFRQDRDFLYLPKYEEKSFTPSTSTFASSSLSSLSTTGQHYDPFLSSSSWLDPPSVSPLSLSRSQLDERRRRRRVPLRAVSPSPFYHSSSSSSPYLSFALVFITSSILLYSARQMTQSSSPSLSHFFPGQKGDLLGDIFNSLLLEQRQKQRKRAMKTMRRPPSVNSQTNHHPVEPTKDSKDNSSSSLARIPPPLSLSPSSLFPSSSSLLDSNLSPSLLSAFSSSPSPSKPQSSSFSGFFFGEDFSEWTSLGMQGDQERLLRAHLSSGSNRRRRRAATTSLLTGEGGGDLQEDDARRLLSSTVFPSFFLPKNEALIEADREETPLGEVAEFLKYDLRRLARLPSFLRRFPPEEKYEIREYLDSYTRLLSSSASSPLEELRGTGLKEEEGEEEGEKKEIFSPEKRGYQFWNRVLQGYGLREYFNTKYRQKMKDLSSSLSSLSSSSSSLSASTVDGMTPSSSSSKKGPFTKSELDHQVERVRAKYHLASIHWYTYKLIQADLVEYLDQLAASAASASSSSSFPSSDDDSERKGPVGEGDNVSSSSLPLQNKSKSGSAPLPSSDSQVYIQHFGKFAVPAEVSKNMISYLTFQVELLRHKALQAKHFLTILKLHRQLQNSRSSETPANSAAPSSSSAASPSLAEKEAEGFFADTKERGRGGIGSKEDDDSFMYLTPSQRNKILLKKKFYQEQMQNSTNLIKVHESIVKSLRKELKMSFFRHGAGLRFTPTTAAGRKDEGGGKGNMRLFEYHALTW